MFETGNLLTEELIFVTILFYLLLVFEFPILVDIISIGKILYGKAAELIIPFQDW